MRKHLGVFCFVAPSRNRKLEVGPILQEWELRRGREHFDFYEHSEIKSLVICDRFLSFLNVGEDSSNRDTVRVARLQVSPISRRLKIPCNRISNLLYQFGRSMSKFFYLYFHSDKW